MTTTELQRRALGWLAALALPVLGCVVEGPGDAFFGPDGRIDLDAVAASLPPREPRGRRSDDFPDIALTNQHGESLAFFEDLVQDRSILVNFMYTTCPRICPGTTANLVRLHEALGDAVGRDITFVSVSIDPEVDTPEKLHAYWKAFGSHAGWHYLTGSYPEIELLRRRLGVYDLDPEVDADKTQHSGIVTFGNDRSDRWAALPALSRVPDLATTVQRFTGLDPGRGTRHAVSRIYRSAGIVRELRVEQRELVLEHDDIPGLMPAMTMAFEVEALDVLASVRAGGRVRFGVVYEDRRYRIVELALAGD